MLITNDNKLAAPVLSYTFRAFLAMVNNVPHNSMQQIVEEQVHGRRTNFFIWFGS